MIIYFSSMNLSNYFQEPLILRQNLVILILEVYKIGMIEFNKVFLVLIEKIMALTTNRIREVSYFYITK